MTIFMLVAAFILGALLASVVNAAQIGSSEGRMQFQIGELRKSILALHSVVTNLNERVERLDSN